MRVEIYCDEQYPFYGAFQTDLVSELEPVVEMTQAEWEHHKHCEEMFSSWQRWLSELRHGPRARGAMENETR